MSCQLCACYDRPSHGLFSVGRSYGESLIENDEERTQEEEFVCFSIDLDRGSSLSRRHCNITQAVPDERVSIESMCQYEGPPEAYVFMNYPRMNFDNDIDIASSLSPVKLSLPVSPLLSLSGLPDVHQKIGSTLPPFKTRTLITPHGEARPNLLPSPIHSYSSPLSLDSNEVFSLSRVYVNSPLSSSPSFSPSLSQSNWENSSARRIVNKTRGSSDCSIFHSPSNALRQYPNKLMSSALDDQLSSANPFYFGEPTIQHERLPSTIDSILTPPFINHQSMDIPHSDYPANLIDVQKYEHSEICSDIPTQKSLIHPSKDSTNLPSFSKRPTQPTQTNESDFNQFGRIEVIDHDDTGDRLFGLTEDSSATCFLSNVNFLKLPHQQSSDRSNGMISNLLSVPLSIPDRREDFSSTNMNTVHSGENCDGK